MEELGGVAGAPPPPTPTPRDVPLMRPGDVVLLDMNGEKWAFINLKRGGTACVGKHRAVSLDPLIDQPFGGAYEVDQDGVLYPAERAEAGDWDEGVVPEDDDERTNAEINDMRDNSAQGLSHDDIHRLKKAGVGAAGLVRQLCENSSTFHAKTAFAQEKYKKKKLAKHLTRVRARFPSARAICEAYFYKQPAAINYLRYDALGMLLSLGNVGADAAPLVVETCGGLVVAAAADRMGGRGRLCAAHAGAEKATMDIARLMNLTDAARESIVTCALGDLIKARSDPEAWSVEAKTREEAAVEARAAIEADKAAKLAAAGGDIAIGAPTRKKPEGWRSRRIRDAAPGDVSAMCRDDEGFTSLIIASPALDPSVALDALLPLLAPSAPFAVWNPASGPLAEALEALRSTHAAVGLALHEPWLRKHQVLPGRTHPTMTTGAGSGGYVLSGTYVPAWARGGRTRAKDSRGEEDGGGGKRPRAE